LEIDASGRLIKSSSHAISLVTYAARSADHKNPAAT